MAKSIYELITSADIVAYWETLYSNTLNYLGASLFPTSRVQGLRLDYIKGYNKLPVALMPSAFDAKPTLRDRGGINIESTRMPFFREAMRIGEEDRQQLLTFLAANSAFANDIITRLFDDASALIEGAIVTQEIMRFSLLQTGKIDIASPDTSGIDVNYSYNYDPTGAWNSSNVITLTGNEVWGGTEQNVVANILAVKRKAAAKGKAITRAIVSPATWALMLQDSAILQEVSDINGNYTGLGDADLVSYLSRKTGIIFQVYEKMYTALDGTEKAFMNDNKVVFLPASACGRTCMGTTPEEADLMSGNTDATVTLTNSGIAVLTKKESLPVNVITSVSEITLPSFENMNSVFVLNTGKVSG